MIAIVRGQIKAVNTAIATVNLVHLFVSRSSAKLSNKKINPIDM